MVFYVRTYFKLKSFRSRGHSFADKYNIVDANKPSFSLFSNVFFPFWSDHEIHVLFLWHLMLTTQFDSIGNGLEAKQQMDNFKHFFLKQTLYLSILNIKYKCKERQQQFFCS